MRASLLARATVRRENPIITTSNSLCFLCFFAAKPSLTPCSESFPETDLKLKVVRARAQSSGRSLLVLRKEREPIGNAIFERQNLIRIRSDVGRIRDRHFLADSSSQRQPRSRSGTCRSSNYRIDLKARETKKLARCSLCRGVDECVSKQT